MGCKKNDKLDIQVDVSIELMKTPCFEPKTYVIMTSTLGVHKDVMFVTKMLRHYDIHCRSPYGRHTWDQNSTSL